MLAYLFIDTICYYAVAVVAAVAPELLLYGLWHDCVTGGYRYLPFYILCHSIYLLMNNGTRKWVCVPVRKRDSRIEDDECEYKWEACLQMYLFLMNKLWGQHTDRRNYSAELRILYTVKCTSNTPNKLASHLPPNMSSTHKPANRIREQFYNARAPLIYTRAYFMPGIALKWAAVAVAEASTTPANDESHFIFSCILYRLEARVQACVYVFLFLRAHKQTQHTLEHIIL